MIKHFKGLNAKAEAELGPITNSGHNALAFYRDCISGKEDPNLEYKPVMSEKALAKAAGKFISEREQTTVLREIFRENPDH